jgi:hypothetical protein
MTPTIRAIVKTVARFVFIRPSVGLALATKALDNRQGIAVKRGGLLATSQMLETGRCFISEFDKSLRGKKREFIDLVMRHGICPGFCRRAFD